MRVGARPVHESQLAAAFELLQTEYGHHAKYYKVFSLLANLALGAGHHRLVRGWLEELPDEVRSAGQRAEIYRRKDGRLRARLDREEARRAKLSEAKAEGGEEVTLQPAKSPLKHMDSRIGDGITA